MIYQLIKKKNKQNYEKIILFLTPLTFSSDNDEFDTQSTTTKSIVYLRLTYLLFTWLARPSI